MAKNREIAKSGRKELSRTAAIIKFAVIGVLVLLGITAIFASFRVPFTIYRYEGLYGAIESKMGIDLKGGVLAVFDCESQEGGDAISLDQVKATENRLLTALSRAGLTEATVQHQGNGPYKIRVEVPGLSETDEVFDAIGKPANLDFRLSETDIRVVAKDIKKVEVYQNPETYEYGVLLTFTNDGGKKFREMVTTAGQGGTTYIYRNNEKFSTVTIQDTSAGSNNTTVITLGKENATRADAEDFKLQIESGLFEVKLKTAETSIITPTLGGGALSGSLISLAIGLAFIVLFMFFRYGHLGLLSNLCLCVFMVLFLLSLAIVPSVQLTLPGIAGIVLSVGMSVDANIIIFERIRDEFHGGKNVGAAIENGFNKSFWTIFDANVTTCIGAVVLFFLGTGPIKGFAITLLLGVVISMFCSLVVLRSFTKLYMFLRIATKERLRLVNTNQYINDISLPIKAPAVAKGKRSLNMGASKS